MRVRPLLVLLLFKVSHVYPLTDVSGVIGGFFISFMLAALA